MPAMNFLNNNSEISPRWKLRPGAVWALASFPRVNVGAMMEG